MTLFTTNYNNLKAQNEEYKPIPEGIYECIIEDTRPDATPNFTPKLVIGHSIPIVCFF